MVYSMGQHMRQSSDDDLFTNVFIWPRLTESCQFRKLRIAMDNIVFGTPFCTSVASSAMRLGARAGMFVVNKCKNMWTVRGIITSL